MDDKTAQQILQSLSKLDDKISLVQADLTAMKLQVASSTAKSNAEIERHSKDIENLYQIHKTCENVKCAKYAELDDIRKKLSGVEWFLKVVTFIGSSIIICVTIFRAVKGI